LELIYRILKIKSHQNATDDCADRKKNFDDIIAQHEKQLSYLIN
jgi:hypothetical protein